MASQTNCSSKTCQHVFKLNGRAHSVQIKLCSSSRTYVPMLNLSSRSQIQLFKLRGQLADIGHLLSQIRRQEQQKGKHSPLQPKVTRNYCQVCRQRFDDYRTHSKSQNHTLLVRSHRIRPELLKLQKKYREIRLVGKMQLRGQTLSELILERQKERALREKKMRISMRLICNQSKQIKQDLKIFLKNGF